MPLATQPEPSTGATYALGTPLNRPPDGPKLDPIAGRPNWFRDAKGAEKYIEPPAKKPDIPV